MPSEGAGHSGRMVCWSACSCPNLHPRTAGGRVWVSPRTQPLSSLPHPSARRAQSRRRRGPAVPRGRAPASLGEITFPPNGTRLGVPEDKPHPSAADGPEVWGAALELQGRGGGGSDPTGVCSPRRASPPKGDRAGKASLPTQGRAEPCPQWQGPGQPEGRPPDGAHLGRKRAELQTLDGRGAGSGPGRVVGPGRALLPEGPSPEQHAGTQVGPTLNWCP